jgi:hypothetical protein
VTLLETVLAVVILGLVAAAITGAIATIESLNTRARQTVAAYELAHRLVLTSLDDKDRLPDQSRPLDYGNFHFVWDRSEDPVRMHVSDAQVGHGSNPQAMGRFRMLSVNVYAAEGDAARPQKGVQLATLNRLYDPAAPRNPESIRVYQDPAKVGDLIKLLTDPENSGMQGRAGGRTGTEPRR